MMTKRSSRTLAVLACAGWLLVLFEGCSGGQQAAHSASAGPPCAIDADCREDRFCDRGICARRVSWRAYGEECDPLPPYAQLPERYNDICRGYICQEGTCRSCQSDAECLHWKGRPTCAQFGDFPGKQCGTVVPGQVCPNGNLPLPQDWYVEGPVVLSIPPIVLPDGGAYVRRKPDPDCRTWPDEEPEAAAPEASANSRDANKGGQTPSLGNGIRCRADGDCESGFCDRRICTDPGGARNGNHGLPCTPEPPRIPGEWSTSIKPPRCGEYLCVDGRCRSCETDAECKAGLGWGTCAHEEGLPGKRCAVNHEPFDPYAPPPGSNPPPSWGPAGAPPAQLQ